MKARIPGANNQSRAAMLAQVQKAQEDMQNTQAELEATEYEGSAASGAVKVVVDGKHTVKSVKISPDIIDPEDAEMLEDLVTVAVNDAISKAAADYDEKMSAITYRTVTIRVVFALAIFIFFKDVSDAWMVPGFTLIGNCVAMVVAYIHVNTKLGIGFSKPDIKHTVHEFTHSIQFFFSRFASTAYTSLNIIILDMITKGGAAASYYGSSNQLITAGRNALMPISDSMYPYMAKHRDFKLVKKMLLLIEPIIFAGCIVVYIIAIPFCEWFFGAEFAEAGHVLRAMLPLAVITLPNYILGFPTMTAMGKTKHANYSTIVGSIFHICLLGVLWLTGNLSADKAMLSLAWSVSATEAVILGYRLIVIYKFRHLMRGVPAEDGAVE